MTSLKVTVTVIDLAGASTSRVVQTMVNDQAFRNSLAPQYGTYKANSTDVAGVIRGIPRRTVSSLPLVAGGVYRDLDVTAPYLSLPVSGAPVVFRNTRFLGPPIAIITGSTALIRAWPAHAPVEFYDCTFDPQAPSFRVSGLIGHHAVMHRCEFTNVVDGLSTFNSAAPDADSGIGLYGSWIHDLAYWPNPPDTSHVDGSHPDCWQIQGGLNNKMVGCYLDAHIGAQYGLGASSTDHANAAVMIAPNVGRITVDFQYNHFFGGGFSVNIANKAGVVLGDIGTISYNRFGRDQWQQNGGGDRTYTISMPANVGCVTEGNVYADDHHPVYVRRNG